MTSFKLPAAAAISLLLLSPGITRAGPPLRRHGLDVEANAGVLGSLCQACDGTEVGWSFGGAVLYRPLPHLAVGASGEALFFPSAQNRGFGDQTVLTGLAGPTVRSYFVGGGIVDGYAGLTIGPSWLTKRPSTEGADFQETPLVGLEHAVGAEVLLNRRLRLTASAALTMIFVEAFDGQLPPAPGMPPPVKTPAFSMSFRLGVSFAALEGAPARRPGRGGP
jgi:hypothetical protein